MNAQFNISEFQELVIQELSAMIASNSAISGNIIASEHSQISGSPIIIQASGHVVGPVAGVTTGKIVIRERLSISDMGMLIQIVKESESISEETKRHLEEALRLERQILVNMEEIRNKREMEDKKDYQDYLLEKLLSLDPEQKDQKSKEIKIATTSVPFTNMTTKNNQSAIQQTDVNQHEAEKIIARKDIRALLCPALGTASDDVFEIAKVVTPILVGLVLAGTISIPLTPVLFASIALLISRMGISGLCKEHSGKKRS